MVAEANKFLGDPYIYGAEGPAAFDCSGLVQYVYRALGDTAIPRTSEEQWHYGTAVSQADAQPGDLVFFVGGEAGATANNPGHVGIYLGNGQMINAPHTGTVVQTASVDGNVGFRRPSSLQAGGGTTNPLLAGLNALVDTGASGIPGASALGGLLSWPGDIVNFFKSAANDLEKSAAFFAAFFRPSTYIRIGAGIAGSVLVVTGLFLLSREATASA